MNATEIRGLRFLPRAGVYSPAEDSLLLLDALARRPPLPGATVVEACCGHALAAIASARLGARAIAGDSSAAACCAARANARENGVPLGVVRGDILSWTSGRFDLVLFNPPYLPDEAPGDPTLDGGTTGGETLAAFVAQLPDRLAPGGRAIAVAGSRTGDVWRASAERHGFRASRIAESKLPWETLSAWEIVRGKTLS